MRAFPLSRRSLIYLCSVFISISQSLPALPFWVMGLSGLEPPTSRLSGVRSNRLSYKPIESGIHLLSHAVSSIVPSAAYVLTVVFGMGTGVSPKRISTRKVLSSFLVSHDLKTKQYIKPSPLTLDSIRPRQVFGWAFTLNSVRPH